MSEAHFLEGLLHGLPVLVVGMGGPGVGMVPMVCPSHFHPNHFFTQNALFRLRTCPFPPLRELGSHISLQMRSQFGVTEPVGSPTLPASTCHVQAGLGPVPRLHSFP